MRLKKGYATHKCCAANRRATPMISGDPDLDAAIAKSRNPDVPELIKSHIDRGNSYGLRSGYNNYTGPSYRGDD